MEFQSCFFWSEIMKYQWCRQIYFKVHTLFFHIYQFLSIRRGPMPWFYPFYSIMWASGNPSIKMTYLCGNALGPWSNIFRKCASHFSKKRYFFPSSLWKATIYFWKMLSWGKLETLRRVESYFLLVVYLCKIFSWQTAWPRRFLNFQNTKALA